MPFDRAISTSGSYEIAKSARPAARRFSAAEGSLGTSGLTVTPSSSKKPSSIAP